MISEARLPRPVAQAIDELSKLPSIGPKTASRLVFYLLKQPPAQAEALSAALVSLHARLDYCAVCHTITESNPCAICADEQRDHQQICVVSEPLDCYALEKTGQFRGVYHVLQGEISPVDGIGPENLKIKELIDRVKDSRPSITEIVLATNPTTEGETTAMYLAKILEPYKIRITRIAHGVPVGGDIEYADEITLSNALLHRQQFISQ